MELQVTGCKDCPFRDEIENTVLGDDEEEEEAGDYIIQYYCKHPKRFLINMLEDENGIITPSDCPLLKESTTISIKPE